MKDSEFNALLNLYLDQEISAEDAARLEAEVQRRPARRKLYDDYCRMQKACKILAKDFQGESAGDRKVIAFPGASRRRRGAAFYAATTFAAAASLAIIFVNRSTEEAPYSSAPEPSVATTTIEAPSIAAVEPRALEVEEIAPGAIARVEMTPARLANIKRALVQNVLEQVNTTQRASFTAMERHNQFDWMNRVQLAPMQSVPAETLRFEARPANPTDVRTFQSHEPPSATPEMTAFRFQR